MSGARTQISALDEVRGDVNAGYIAMRDGERRQAESTSSPKSTIFCCYAGFVASACRPFPDRCHME